MGKKQKQNIVSTAEIKERVGALIQLSAADSPLPELVKSMVHLLQVVAGVEGQEESRENPFAANGCDSREMVSNIEILQVIGLLVTEAERLAYGFINEQATYNAREGAAFKKLAGGKG